MSDNTTVKKEDNVDTKELRAERAEKLQQELENSNVQEMMDAGEKYTIPYVIKRFWREDLSKHKYKLFITIFSITLVSASMGLQVQMIKPLVDELLGGQFNPWQVGMFAAAFFALGLFKGAMVYLQAFLSNLINSGIVRSLQKRFFAKVIRDDVETIEANGSGDYVARIQGGLAGLSGITSSVFMNLPRQITLAISYFGVMLYNSVEMTLLTFIIFPLILIPMSRMGKKMEAVAKTDQGAMALSIGRLNDTLRSSRQVKAYNLFNYVQKSLNETFDMAYDVAYKRTKVSAAMAPIMEILAAINIGAVMGVGGYLAIQNKITAGEFIAFLMALSAAYRPLKAIADIKVGLHLTRIMGSIAYGTFDATPKIIDKPDAKPLTDIKGDIAFKDVHFDYATKNNIINGIDLKVPAGKSVAFVGNSGGGKSTSLNLIARFYEVTKGSIAIDGNNIKDVTLESLRDSMALVSQETILFNTTIKENIRMGKLDATEDEIITACKRSAAWEFICEMPNGLDSMVGENATQLSGGQRQRIAIARAFLKDAPILLLDEATSALDMVSEKKIQKTLDELSKGRTTVTIAHRLSTIQGCDLIYVIDGGKVVESGSHIQLRAADGVYEALCKAQKL